MKKLFIILFFIPALSQAQLTSFIVGGDTLFSVNPSAMIETQLTKTIPSRAGQSGKILSNNGTDFVWVDAPAGGGGGGYTTVVLPSDVTNSTVTIADVTGLSFPVTSGITYKFKFYIIYTSAATTTGSRWSINGPATTLLQYTSRYNLSATAQTTNFLSAYNLPAAANASSLTAGNCAIIEGVITPSANGTVIARFASEIAASAIVAKAKSYVEYQAQ